MFHIRKKLAASMLAVSLFAAGGAAVWAEGEYKTIEVFFERVKIAVNGQASQIDKDSILYNGSVYIPLRSLGEMLGAEVSWDSMSRSVHLDFLTDRSSELLQSSKMSMYQYIVLRNNSTMSGLKTAIHNSDSEGMKKAVTEYEELRQVAEGIGEKEMAEAFNKLKAATEMFRGGWESKNTDDYLLAWSIYSSSNEQLITMLRAKIKSGN
jgi:mevalonate kinase